MSTEKEALALLKQARAHLHEQLSGIEFEGSNSDHAINTISLIVRTLEKIEQMTKALKLAVEDGGDQPSAETREKLRAKIKGLIKETER